MANLDHARVNHSLRKVLETSFGKDVIWHILGLCGIYSVVSTEGPMVYYIEGKRAVGLDILQLLENVDPTMYANLQLHFIKDAGGE